MSRRLLKLLAIIVTFSLLAAACGSDDEPTADANDTAAAASDTGDGAADDAATDAAASDTGDGAADDAATDTDADDGATDADAATDDGDAAAGADDGDQGAMDEMVADGNLRIALLVGLRNWDPHPETRAFGLALFDPVYDGLINQDQDGTLVPGLATSWEETEDSITFQLREGVTFHDGTPFDGDAVAYNIEKVKATPGTAGLSMSSVDSVEVVSPTEVVFHLNRPSPELPSILSLAQGRIISPNVSVEDVAAGVPAGTGPYMISEITEASYVLEPHADFWDHSQQGLERIEWLLIGDDEARLNSLLDGQADVAFIRAPQVATAEGSGFSIASTISNVSVFQITDIDGTTVPELADERVRQALAHAISRDGWGAAATLGVGAPADQILEPGSPFYIEGYEGYPYDPDRARELLAEAGATDLEFDIAAFGGFLLGATVLQAMFAEVGVTLNVNQVGPAELTPAIAGGDVPAAYTFIPDTHAETIWNKHLAPGSIHNWTSAMLDDVRAGHDGGAAGDNGAYQDMLQAAYESAWITPIWYNEHLLAYDEATFGELVPWDFVTFGFNIRGLTAAS